VIDPGSTGFGSLLQQLDSSDKLTRRRARSDLSRLGLDLVRPATVALLSPDLSYRVRRGLAVALGEMLRDAKGQRAEAIAEIDDASLRQLLLLSTDVDRTIQIYAGEFLYDLGDPRVFRLVAGVWAEAPPDDGRYNLALAMKGAAPFVQPGEREGAQEILGGYIEQVGPQTGVLLRDAISLLR